MEKREQTDGCCGEGVGAGMEWEVGVLKCKLLWINNKVLLNSTENYSQYHMISPNGKEYLKKNIYIYTYMYS